MKRPHLAYHLRIGLKETYLQRKARRQKIHVPLHLIETGSADEIIGLFTICPHCGTQRLPDKLLAHKGKIRWKPKDGRQNYYLRSDVEEYRVKRHQAKEAA